jgi:prolyl oligopeptidase
MNRLLTAVLVCALIPTAQAGSDLPSPPPSAPIRPVTDDYFGVPIIDPYRYLENTNDPEVRTWMKAQADYSRSMLDRLPGRQMILSEIRKFVDAAPATVSEVRICPGGLYFFLKTPADQNVAQLYLRRGLHGKDELIVDTNRLAGPHGEPPAINYWEPSFDGRYVAYGVSQGGSENATLHIVDVQTQKDLPETIDREEFGGVCWRPDNQAFFYNRLQKVPPGSLAKYDKTTAYLHVLGTSVDSDIAVHGFGVSPLIPMEAIEDAEVYASPGSDYAIAQVGHGVAINDELFAAPLQTVGRPGTPWAKICGFADNVTEFAIHGNDLYLLSHDDAPRFKILHVNLSHPDIQNAETFLPQQKTVLRGIGAASDALYVKELDGAIGHVLRVGYDGKSQQISLPFEGGVIIESADLRLPGVAIGISSWVKGPRIVQYDPATDTTISTDLQPAGPNDNLPELDSVELNVPSYDGTLVPLSVMFKKGVKLDGHNPTMVYAYGGYGITSESGFTAARLPWIERGGIYAVAHVRGGGELGENWHMGAYKLTKPNVWRDLIACCQYLVEKKYTTPSHLAIYGGSNGGITMGRAITERPDLFAAAAIRSGEMNNLRSENFPNGPPNVPEFGSVKTLEGFEDLLAMDSYQHVRDGIAYPAVLESTGINDPRVPVWMPTKMTARLQAATSSGKPVLLTIDYQGGHGIGASKRQTEDQTADMDSFFLWQFGDPAFQPAAPGVLTPDIAYAHNGGETQLLDAWTPQGPGPFPVAIIVHGGGWSSGNKRADIMPLFVPLCNAKFVWFSIDYRLAPAHRWPDCLTDLNSAIVWIKANAARFGGDPKRIAIIGESSGAQMICLAEALATPETRVAAVVGFAPPNDMVADTERRGGLSPSAQQLLGMKLFDDKAREILKEMSAINYVTAAYPPMLLIHGTADKSVLYQQSLNFQARLRQLGVPCDLITIENAPHGVEHWEGGDTSYKQKMIDWLRKTLGA